MNRFDRSREALARGLSANRPGSTTPHVVVELPSYSVGDSLLAHYAHRLPALEHRYLLALLMLARVPGCELLFLTCSRPPSRVLDYYLSLLPRRLRGDVASRFHVIEIPDLTPRPLSAKLLDRPDLLDLLRRLTRGRVAYIEPWNVTPLETDVAERLGIPVNGTAPELWPLGFKSAGRKLMRDAGVPVPAGREDVRSAQEIVDAALEVGRRRPSAAGVVVKTDNSGTGDGNRVLRLPPSGRAEYLRAAVDALEPWYLRDIGLGAVVEELVEGEGFASPSVQVDITPDGHVTVISTHEQVLGGDNGQVYLGCLFPADSSYGSLLATYGQAVGRVLAERGALGRLSVDFAAARNRVGTWEVFGLEINLRKGGTSHPYTGLCNLVPGRYDGARGRWLTEDGNERAYRATDNLVDPAWVGRGVEEVIETVRGAGLTFDRRSRTGVVLHMFSGLEIDGRIGLTAFGISPRHADTIYRTAVDALSERPADEEVPVPV